MATPVTGAQHEIAAGDFAAVVTELGAGLRQLLYRGQPLIAGYAADELPPGAAGQLLVPWPNRVDGGRYRVGGTGYQLDLSEPAAGNAIHGLTRWSRWVLAGQSAGRVRLRETLLGREGYPFCLEIEADYQLSAEDGLQLDLTARNVGSRPAPYGAGAHPYLTAGTELVDACRLSLPASQWLPTGERGIPAGPPRDVSGTEFDFRDPRPVAGTRFDHAFTGLARDGHGRTWAWLAGGQIRAGLWAGPGYGWLQVYTGDTLAPDLRRRALAVEPMTCPPNAFVTGTGLIMLAPGDSVTHQWGIGVSRP